MEQPVSTQPRHTFQVDGAQASIHLQRLRNGLSSSSIHLVACTVPGKHRPRKYIKELAEVHTHSAPSWWGEGRAPIIHTALGDSSTALAEGQGQGYGKLGLLQSEALDYFYFLLLFLLFLFIIITGFFLIIIVIIIVINYYYNFNLSIGKTSRKVDLQPTGGKADRLKQDKRGWAHLGG